MLRKKWKDILWHWDRGEHNNIKKCCRVWFLLRMGVHWHEFLGKFPGYNPFNWWWNRRSENLFYVRCPICAFRRINNPVHSCDISCSPKYYHVTSIEDWNT